MKIILSGAPKSTQHLYRYTCRGKFGSYYMTAEAKALKEQYQWEVKSQWTLPIIKEDVEIHMALYFPTKRKGDIDNFCKIAFDSMTGVVFDDDKQIVKLTIEKFYDKHRPRICIEVDSAVV